MKIYLKLLYFLFLSNVLLGQSEDEWMEQYFENSGDEYLKEALDAYESIDAIEDFDEIKGYKALSKVYPWMKPIGSDSDVTQQETLQSLMLKGESALDQQNFISALNSFDRALIQSDQIHGGRKHHPLNIHIYNGIARAKVGQGKLEEAVEAAEQSIRAGIKKEGLRTSGTTQLDDLIYPVEVLPNLERKGQILIQLYQQKKRKSDLLKAMIEFEKAIDLMSLIRKKYESDELKTYLNLRARKLCESGIRAALQLYKTTKDKQYLAKAFSFSEKGKSAILLDALMKSADQEIAMVPDSLLKRESFLKAEIEHWENKIKQADQKGRPAKSVRKWSDKVFKYQEELLRIQSDIESEYPLAEQWQFDVDPVDLKTIQNHFQSDDKGMLSYFIGDERAYVFSITQDDVGAIALGSSPSIKKNVLDFAKLQTNQDFETDARGFLEKYLPLAHEVYTQLLSKALRGKERVKQWTIFPDDVLWMLPFEVVLTKQTDVRKISFSPEYLPYWLKQVSISYAYSASVLIENQTNDHSNAGFIGFAPQFDGPDFAMRNCQEEELGALKYNQEEVDAIHKLMGGDKALGGEASKNRFMHNVSSPDILHIATHACVNADEFLESKIYFTDGALTAKEIYQLKMKAPMVVLSACETGIGRLKVGEGMMSLARAFTYAGCPSLVTSLWSVSDASTSDLMVRFYGYLEEGWSKSEALRLAKLDYMKEQDIIHQNPFYWAGFVMIGNDAPIGKASPFGSLDWKWMILGFLVLLFIFRNFSKSKSKKR